MSVGEQFPCLWTKNPSQIFQAIISCPYLLQALLLRRADVVAGEAKAAFHVVQFGAAASEMDLVNLLNFERDLVRTWSSPCTPWFAQSTRNTSRCRSGRTSPGTWECIGIELPNAFLVCIFASYASYDATAFPKLSRLPPIQSPGCRQPMRSLRNVIIICRVTWCMV